jgi:hypothetical protein
MTAGEAAATIRSTIPARLDRLSWSPFHITKPITSTAPATEIQKPPEQALPEPLG